MGGIAALLALFPQAAAAHLVSTGMGPFYDGMSHVFLTPDDVLAIVALALFSGLGGRRFTLLLSPAQRERQPYAAAAKEHERQRGEVRKY